ncbi:arylsulfatase [Flavihumibacter petaseus]|uniref:Putative arylsulfatase n=1 Tax=Flavihumibacter petaseus NBRC 106054 TaxID=1220578 RepID=A0A0E9MWP5_9BACT|nr:arylsulfatase [Flavihumibacter petaseus]GAO41913.1 putative arylsulfatase [Flavihumibacter petaseus NBRC 106054]
MNPNPLRLSFNAVWLLPAVILVQQVAAQYSPRPAFSGKAGKTLTTSVPGRTVFNPLAPKKAPNILYIMLDDVGFGASSAFGGLIETPVFDSLADNGLRFTNFHTTAICSPSRASLLTGRNHHSVNVATVIDAAVDYPGHNGYMPFEKATIAEIALENGYNTFAVGKWHITPTPDITPAGPFNRWPTGRGFERFYGFLAGETDEYTPMLWENNNKIEPDLQGKQLTTVLADKAIEYIAGQKSAAPDKPFLLYFTPGATHGPHQVEQEWIDKYKGRFDKGWDWYRSAVLERQKKLGIVPANVTLPPPNPGVKAWDSLTATEKKIFTRFFEAYAGFLSQTDFEVGRVISYLKEIGQLNNTIVVLIIGDNGASKEGGLTGHANSINEYIDKSLFTEDYQERIRDIEKQYDDIGTSRAGANYPEGWAQAANTPFRYLKQDANSEGGTRNPLIIFYPDGIRERGIRRQYSHINSVTPTVIDLAALKVPQQIKGYQQDSLEGISVAYTIKQPDAPDRHHVQYYEIGGGRAIYKDGWKAAVYHVQGTPFEHDRWSLFNLTKDFNEQVDLAAKEPAKLNELVALFDLEAAKYNVYPLLGDTSLRAYFQLTKGPFDLRRQAVLYPGLTQLPARAAPLLLLHSFSIEADVESGSQALSGALLALGGRFNGFSFYVQNGKLEAAHNKNGKIDYLKSDVPIPSGRSKLRFVLMYNNAKNLTDPAGTEALFINDQKVAERPITKADAYIMPYDEGLDVGRDNASSVVPVYRAPFAFTGKLHTVTINY